MSVYLHVPFCRSKCFYCGFYSVASGRLKEEYIRALCTEIGLRKNYLASGIQETLYLGGGTPSYLDLSDMEKVILKLEEVYSFADNAERTIEMNPEDMDAAKLSGLRALGFNRLSVGVQSFHDDILKQINRTHSAKDAERAIGLAVSAGFENVGMDLIMGLPGQTMKELEQDMEVVKRLPLSHLSVYILSIDSNSVFEKLLQKGKFKPDDDDELAEKYTFVSEYMRDIGFEHYEISNFARDKKYAVHNTAYWQQKPYIGLGASAHSYNGVSRQWNIANLNTYISGLSKGVLNYEKEELSIRDRYNERIMTNLRTMWGTEVEKLAGEFPGFWGESQRGLQPYLSEGYAVIEGGRLKLTTKGWLISDRIFSDLFA